MFKSKVSRTFARLVLLALAILMLIVAVGGEKFRRSILERFDLDTAAMYYGYFAFLATIFIVTYYVLKEFADNNSTK